MSNAISVELAEFLVSASDESSGEIGIDASYSGDVCTVKPAWDLLSRISKVRSACLDHLDISGLPTS